MNQDIEISRSKRRVKINAPQEIDLSIRQPLMDLARRNAGEDSAEWILDLSRTTEVKESGLTALRSVYDALWSEMGASIQMRNAKPDVMTRLQAAGLI